MSDVLRTAHQVTNNSVTRNCRLQAIGGASCTMVNKPNALATESGDQRASSQSAHTQQLAISENNDLNTPAAPAAAQAAAGAAGSKQPASPDSVNAGQPGKAPAQQHATSPASTDPAATAAGTTSAEQQTASHPHSSSAPTTSADLTEHQQQQGQLQQQVPVAVQEPQQPKQQQQGQELQQELQQRQAGPELEALEPLPPPDASEGPEAVAEYDAYLQRWRAGDTLAQRWQRLKSKGLLADLRTEWEDWQHDLLLDTIQMQLCTPGGLAAAAAATAAGRQRRGRAEMEAAAANAPAAAAGPGQEPRRVRTRRAPASFQDFHLEGRASGSPDRADVHLSGAAAADVQRRMLAVQQQLHHGWHGLARAAGPGGGHPQQAQAALPVRQSNLGRQQLLPPRGAQGPQGQQQQQPGAGILSEEFMQKFRATVDMVRSSGSAGGMEGAAALLADPAALHAFVSALSKHTDDPAAAMHRVAATLAAHATQQQQQQQQQPQQ